MVARGPERRHLLKAPQVRADLLDDGAGRGAGEDVDEHVAAHRAQGQQRLELGRGRRKSWQHLFRASVISESRQNFYIQEPRSKMIEMGDMTVLSTHERIR